MSAISITFTSLWSAKSPVPKYRLDFSAATILLSDNPFATASFIPSKDREKEPPYFIEVNGSAGTGFINELNDINIYKIIIDTYRNRDNWNLDK